MALSASDLMQALGDGGVACNDKDNQMAGGVEVVLLLLLAVVNERDTWLHRNGLRRYRNLANAVSLLFQDRVSSRT